MKQEGLYIARQLDFQGIKVVEEDFEEMEMDRKRRPLQSGGWKEICLEGSWRQGISLQSDRREKESRVHIPVELPWAIQQGHIGGQSLLRRRIQERIPQEDPRDAIPCSSGLRPSRRPSKASIPLNCSPNLNC